MCEKYFKSAKNIQYRCFGQVCIQKYRVPNWTPGRSIVVLFIVRSSLRVSRG